MRYGVLVREPNLEADLAFALQNGILFESENEPKGHDVQIDFSQDNGRIRQFSTESRDKGGQYFKKCTKSSFFNL